MVNSNYSYQYETSPRKLEPQYRPQKKKNITSNIDKKKQEKKNIKVKKNKKIKLKAVAYLTIGFIILFTIMEPGIVYNH